MEPGATSQFRSLDPDLPSIAALAAAEVDGLLRHESADLSNLNRLAKVLKLSFGARDAGTGPRHLLDPVSTQVFASAGRDALASSLTSYAELASASLEFAQQMSQASANVGIDELTKLKQFCLALSRHALVSSDAYEVFAQVPEYKR